MGIIFLNLLFFVVCCFLAIKKNRNVVLIGLGAFFIPFFSIFAILYLLSLPNIEKTDNENKKSKGKIMNITECFEILGVSKNATQEEIKKAYDEKIRIFNENKKTDPLNATTNIKKIQEAFDVLYR